jgi:uncharacterized protein (UPF0332 family)
MGKINFKDLVEKGQLKRESYIGPDQVERFLKRADKDLASSAKLVTSDEVGAMDFIYKAVFHAANGLVRSFGYRPGPVRQHRGVIPAVERILGKQSETLVLKFDQLRKRRNQFEYMAVIEMGTQELKDTMKHTKSIFKTRWRSNS